jgi:hypothetical protein
MSDTRKYAVFWQSRVFPDTKVTVDAKNDEACLYTPDGAQVARRSFFEGHPTEETISQYLRMHTDTDVLDVFETARRMGAEGRLHSGLYMSKEVADNVRAEIATLYPDVEIKEIEDSKPRVGLSDLPYQGPLHMQQRRHPGRSDGFPFAAGSRSRG